MASQFELLDLGPATAEPKPKRRQRHKSRFSEKTIELARELARRPLKGRSPIERMIDEACGIGGKR